MWPAVVVFLMFNEDGPLFPVPQHVVVVAFFAAVDAHEAGVDAVFIKRFDHVAAVRIGADVGYEGAIQPQPGESHGGIGGVADGLNNFGVIKRQFGAERHGQPLSLVVLVGNGLVVEQLNKCVGYDIADCYHVRLLRHCPPFILYCLCS